MKKIFFLFALFFISENVFCQSINNGVDLLKKQKNSAALLLFEDVLRKNKNNVEANYFVGLTKYLLGNSSGAITHLKIAANKNFQTSKIHLGCLENAKFALAEAYFDIYDFSSSVAVLQDLTNTPERLKAFENSNAVSNFLTKAKLAQSLLQRVEDVLFKDSVVVDKKDFLSKYPQNSNIGYLYSECQRGESCNEYGFLSGKKDLKIFAKKDTTQSLNLYKSNFYLSGWSEPAKITGNVNSKYNENFPFLMSDGITLYFASDSQTESLGGYDIFVSSSNSEGYFLKPLNVGMPFNSPFNDYLMALDEKNNIGYFASDRYLPEGKVAIYTFEYNTTKKFISDTSIVNIRNYAKNIVLNTSKNATPNRLETTETITIYKKFNFVIYDTIVYHDYSDFKSKQALEEFKKMEILEDSINSINIWLAQKRENILNGKNIQKDIQQTILEKEYELKTAIIDKKNLIKYIRKLEYEENNQYND